MLKLTFACPASPSLERLAGMLGSELSASSSETSLCVPDDAFTLHGGYSYHGGQCWLTYIRFKAEDRIVEALVDYTTEAGDTSVTVTFDRDFRVVLFESFRLWEYDSNYLPSPYAWLTPELQVLSLRQIERKCGAPLDVVREQARIKEQCSVVDCEMQRTHWCCVELATFSPRLKGYGSRRDICRTFLCEEHSSFPGVSERSALD